MSGVPGPFGQPRPAIVEAVGPSTASAAEAGRARLPTAAAARAAEPVRKVRRLAPLGCSVMGAGPLLSAITVKEVDTLS